MKDKNFSLLNRDQFCCDEIYAHLIGPDKDGCELHFGYDPIYRDYHIDYKVCYSSGGAMQRIYFCPWCGAKFPKGLINEYVEEISKSLGIDPDELDLSGADDPQIPPEFRTDEWWKKRGL